MKALDVRFGVASALAIALAAAPTAAQDAPAEPTIEYLSAQQAYLAALSPKDGWSTLPGGLRWKYLTYAGSDTSPTVSDTVTVHYEGRFIDGKVFDSSYARGTPATFPLGNLIKAWQMAIPEMGVGDVIEIAVPADLGYGPIGKGPIPGDATLVFKVELIAIK